MVGLFRPLALGLVAGLVATIALVPAPASGRQDPSPPKDGGNPQDKDRVPAVLDDLPQPFVPLHPRTVEDQKRVEALRDYAAARALEDRRMLPEAIELLEKALKEDPDSIPIVRRLSRLSFIARRPEAGVRYGRRVIEAAPNDSSTLYHLVQHYRRRNDADGLEALLTGVLANPRLEKTSAAYLLAQHELGMLYRAKMLPMDRSDSAYEKTLKKAADAFGSLLEALDHKEANRLAFADEARILGDEAESYLTFGTVLQEARRYDEAIRAFRHGLLYAQDHPLLAPQLTVQLARALLSAGKPDEALKLAEQFVKEQPQQRSGYDLLVRSLEALKRTDEIIPRLEEISKEQPRNRAVQYALAERYVQAGRRDKASALYEELKANPPSAQDFGALAAWLLQEKKAEDLVKLLGEAVTRRDGYEAIKPQLEAIAKDPALVGQMLEAAQKMMATDPPSLTTPARRVLALLAAQAKQQEKLIPLLRLAIQKDANPYEDYLELSEALTQSDKSGEAADVLEELLKKFPNRRGARLLVQLGLLRADAHRNEAAVEAFHEARKIEPNDPEILWKVSVGLGRVGKTDEALEIARGVLKLDPSNPTFNSLVGSYLVQEGKNDEAIAHYRALLERFPDNDDLVKLARQSLSSIYVTQEQFAKAEEELEILLAKDPDDAGVNNDLGYLYADQGKNLDKAEAMVRKAIAEEPDNYAYLDSMGWVLYKRGKLKEALGYLEKAAADRGGSKDATILDHLGDVYFRLHETAKARTSWEQALKIAADAKPPDKRAAEIRKKIESLKDLPTAPRPSTGDNP